MPVEDSVDVGGTDDVEFDAVNGDRGELLTPVPEGGEYPLAEDVGLGLLAPVPEG